MTILQDQDPQIAQAIQNEIGRQRATINLIASENYASKAVMEAQGSAMTNKYAEGYPGRRYYGGCEHVDVAEQLAIERAKQLFGAEHANVQPHSGSGANMAVYFSALQPGDKILTMDLSHGGHLTHGHKANFSGRFYAATHYGVNKETEQIDYDELARMAAKEKPAMITVGASAYPRVIDFERMGQIAREVDALLLADIAHIAGLIVAGEHPSPAGHAHIVTTTTHKSLRGPRGGMVLATEEHAPSVDRGCPMVLGGPLSHVMAAKAVAFAEARQEGFRTYAQQVADNAQSLAQGFLSRGADLVTGGTDNHLLLVDLRTFDPDLTGAVAQTVLDRAGITLNKNTVPDDPRSPFVTSGVRIGTPSITTQGMEEPEMAVIAELIARTLSGREDDSVVEAVRGEVAYLCGRFRPYAS